MPPSTSVAPGPRIDWTALAYALTIAAVILFAFWPALGHPPRGDQLPFLIDMIQQNSCGDLIHHSYSYNRTRVILPGDTGLFRPLLFVHLSLMQCLGGTHFWLSQAVGIVLHLGVTLLLFALLRLLLREIGANPRMATPAAALAALYFATTPAIMEQVIWTHINAYMLAVLCVLGAIFVQAGASARGALTGRQILALFALSTIACFCFEVALFLPVTLAFCAAAGWMPGNPAGYRRPALALIFLLPVVVYFSANLIDLRIHPIEGGNQFGMSTLLDAASWNTVHNYFRFLDFAVAYPYFSGKPEGFNGRLWITEPHQMGIFATRTLLCVMAALLLAGLHSARQLAPRTRRVALLASGVAMIWLLATAAAMTIARINPRAGHPDVLSTSTYQSYAPYLASMLLAAICVICVAATRGRKDNRPPRRWLVYAGTALLLVAIGVRTGIVHSVNSQLAQIQSPLAGAIWSLNEIRGRDPFATFRMSTSVADQLEHFQGIPVLYVLFARSIDQCGGTYEILAEAPYVTYSGNAKSCYPALVRPDTNYHYYYYRGEFYAMPFWFGFPDETKTGNNPYIARAPTLGQALQEQPARLNRLLADMRSGQIRIPRNSEMTRLR